MIDRSIRLDQRAPPVSGEPAASRYIPTEARTTPVERFLLFVSIAALPLQNYFPTVVGVSSSFLLFVALAAYVIVCRLRSLDKIWCHPVFIAAYAFFVISVLLEFSSPLPEYYQCKRFAEMIGGMICVATICRDRSILTVGLFGYIATALGVSVVLYFTGYEALQGAPADSFHQAEKVRLGAYGEKPMGANLNRLAHVCAQGALVAFALCLSDKWKRLRVPLLGVVAVCIIGSFLAMSRGAAVVMLVGLVVILYAGGFRQGKALILVSILGMGVYTVVPDATWSRMEFSTEVKGSGKMESRAKLYTNAFRRLPEYIVAGVGAGNFENKWAFQNGFYSEKSAPDGKSTTRSLHLPHNALILLTIFWGILALLVYLLIAWCVYRSIPLQCGRDGLSLALLGIMVSLGALLLYGNDFSDKTYAIGVGMLVGARRWIWPNGIVSAVEGNRYPSAAIRT